MGGKDVPENQIKTCDTGHYNIHRLLGILETRDKQVPVTGPGQKKFGKADPGTSTEQALAMRGFEAWVAAGRPGSRVYEDHAQEPHRWGWE